MPILLSKAYTHKKPILIVLIILIFGLATFLRIDFIQSVQHNVSHDTIHYDLMVRQLLEKGVYAYKDTIPNAKVTPGYPLFMAAIYKIVDYKSNDPFPYIRYIQVLISLMTLWMIYRISQKLSGQFVALIALSIAAVYPPFIWSNGAILTETLAAFVLIMYVYLQLITFEKNTKTFALISGALVGLLVLIRSEFLIIIFPIYAVHFFQKRNIRLTLRLLLFTCIGTGIILTPWVIRNVITMNEVIIASTQVNPFQAGTYPDNNYEDGMVDRKGKTQMELAKERIKVGFTEHTWKFTKWYTVGKLKYIYSHMYFGSGHTPLYPVLPSLLRNMLHLGLVSFSVVALAAFTRKWRAPYVLLGVIFMVMSVIRLAFVPEFRYNYTVMPLIIIMDSIVITAILRWIIHPHITTYLARREEKC
ncbi:ArnT family glycosyltransferase [Paenibacillus sp. FA6]|uniref:ArnT family glycosyltransferase n=1 Tax=Paenibacillus sp. FA6 TaxID=3413029 RepID=UPI003F656EC9